MKGKCAFFYSLLVAIQVASAQSARDVTYDLSTDFSQAANPSGPWSFGWKGDLSGPLNLYSDFWQGYDEGSTLIDVWSTPVHSYPAVFHNGSATTGSSDGGQGTFPPGTVWFGAGFDGAPENYGTIRFTAPQKGVYHVSIAVRHYLDGPSAGDADFHVLRGAQEIFAAAITGAGETGAFSQKIRLRRGETIDMMVGRGADGLLYGSALKIEASFSLGADPTP